MNKDASKDMSLSEFSARALEAAAQAGIAPAEIFSNSSETFSVRVRGGKLEDYKVSDRLSLTLRGRVGERIGTASTQALDEESLQLLVAGVRESAELIATDEQDDILPPDPAYSAVCNYSEALDDVSAGDKIALAMEIDKRLSAADARIHHQNPWHLPP